ncbi:Hypothetical protein CINCED_3A008393 [Cinara cedri]|uniref:Uncharacterized protein n=1 Tax=Cinara cedri TaxID=506608 RepID=A0A5E4MGZ9_9HEMI|nr:Hypothetical protein CINCED_3A008393 [Cinara cedri]
MSSLYKHKSGAQKSTFKLKMEEKAVSKTQSLLGFRVESQLKKQILSETEKWKYILKRLLNVTISSFRAVFRGSSTQISEVNNGNFLGLLELLGRYDEIPREHLAYIQKYQRGERNNSVLKENDKIDRHQELPLNEDGIVSPRLKSRKPFLLRDRTITEVRENIIDTWQAEWLRERLGGIYADNVCTPVLGMDLPRKPWVRHIDNRYV